MISPHALLPRGALTSYLISPKSTMRRTHVLCIGKGDEVRDNCDAATFGLSSDRVLRSFE
jgi:hypothetical protein